MNYLAPLGALAARLTAQLPPDLPVRTAVDLAQVKDMSIGQPEVWVLFHRDETDDTGGSSVLLRYQVAVIYVAPGSLPDLARDGDTLTAITKALSGFQPPLDCDPFKRVGALVPQSWSPDGLVAYGMLFSTSFML